MGSEEISYVLREVAMVCHQFVSQCFDAAVAILGLFGMKKLKKWREPGNVTRGART